MITQRDHWGIRALDFVQDVEATRSADEVERLFSAAIAECGFHAYIIAGLPVAHANPRPLVLADGWPREWGEIYMRENLVTVDPIPRHCFQTAEPLEWSEAPYDKVRDYARACCRVGVAFFDPIHGQTGVAANGIELHPILNITFQ